MEQNQTTNNSNITKLNRFQIKQDWIGEGRIIQVLDNLLSNSVKYSPEGGVVKLAAAAKPDKLEISISDQGVGMSENQLGQIFDKFYRVHTGNRHDVKGFGLGLSYVKALMDAHRGQIDVKSELGKGSTFILTFPYNNELQTFDIEE